MVTRSGKSYSAKRRSSSLRRSNRKRYRRRTMKSHCRKKPASICKRTKGCKQATGKKRKFCRKTMNTRRRKH